MLIPEFSLTAGQNADGFVVGSVKESLLEGALESVTNCPVSKVYRVDTSSGAITLRDITTSSSAFITNGFLPFGDASTFSDGDAFLVGCTEDVQAILYQQDNTATHNGILKVYDSIDGLWADNLIATIAGSDSFRASGWHPILIPDNANRRTFRPSQFKIDGVLPPELRYILFRLEGVTSGTPPSCSGMTAIRKTFKWNDQTSIKNGNTATAPAATSNYVWPESIRHWCFSNPAFGVEIFAHLSSTAVWTDVHEYFASDNTWKPVTGWTDATNNLAIGPSNLGDPVQKLPIRWAIPTDWASKTLTFVADDGSTITKTGYHIRERLLTVTAYGLHSIARYRVRARQFGTANTTGIKSLIASTLRGLAFSQMGQKNTVAINAEAINMDTGAASAFIIPVTPDDPYNADFTDIALAAGQQWGLRIVSGGVMVSVNVMEK